MPSFAITTSIAAPPERIWPVLADVVRWPEWLPTVTSVEALDDPALRLGARYRVLQPRLRPAVWTVGVVEPQRRFVWESRQPGVRTVADHVIVPTAAGASTVTLSVTYTGLLGGVVGLLAGRLTRDYIGQEAASLKQRAES